MLGQFVTKPIQFVTDPIQFVTEQIQFVKQSRGGWGAELVVGGRVWSSGPRI